MSYRVINQSNDVIELQTADLPLAKAFADRLAQTSQRAERFAVVEVKCVYETTEQEHEF